MHLQQPLVRDRRHLLGRVLRPGGLRLRGRACCTRSSAGPTSSGASLVNSIGPIWDGNEMWLVVAGAAIFAAFPAWYATMFSTFYLVLLIVLVALMVRGVSFEYQRKIDDPRWRAHLALVAHHRAARSSRSCSDRLSATCSTGCPSTSPQLHRQLLGAAAALRALHRGDPHGAVPAPRGHLPDPQDRRATCTSGSPGCPADSAGWPLRHLRLPDLEPRRPRRRASSPTRSTPWPSSPSSPPPGWPSPATQGWAFTAAAVAIGSVVGSIFFELFPRVMVSRAPTPPTTSPSPTRPAAPTPCR